MKKIFEFGKIRYTNKSRAVNAVTVTIELTESIAHPCFSCVGAIWNASRSDHVSGGQNLDEIKIFLRNNKTFMEIYNFWKKYHLNDLHAGTPKQEEALKAAGLGNFANRFEECCAFLKERGLYEDGGAKFGATWHYWPIPENDLTRIKALF